MARSPSTATSSMLVFIFAWNLSWGGLMMTVASEMLPQAIRGIGTGLVYAVYWTLSFAASMTLESTFEALGLSPTFAMYGCTTLLALGYAALCVPELKGAALHVVQPALASLASLQTKLEPRAGHRGSLSTVTIESCIPRPTATRWCASASKSGPDCACRCRSSCRAALCSRPPST